MRWLSGHSGRVTFIGEISLDPLGVNATSA